MNLRNCPECGRLYEFTVKALCPNCVNKEEEDYKLIKNCLKHDPGAGIVEVSEKTGVPEKKILAFLKAGRLILEHPDALLLNCERCGKPISSGRYCSDCCALIDKVLESIPGTTDDSSTRGRNEEKQSRFTNNFQK